jgi:prepilin-type N-terminal cleavage/methylation domain-containing protein
MHRRLRTLTSSRGSGEPGFTLVELSIVIVVLGIVMSTLAMAISVAFRTAPQTENRLDDARATRALATWLSHDTTSAPPFLPETAQGGLDISLAPTPTNNDCAAPGSNLLHLQWREAAFSDQTFVANYRFVTTGTSGEIVRNVCSSTGGGPFVAVTSRRLLTGLDPAKPPAVTVKQLAGGNVTSVTFGLTGKSGEKVAIETGSRNPADFFP